MSMNFRKRFLSGERLFGTMLTLPSGSVAEVLSDAGFDWLFVDGEHGPFDALALETVLQAVSRRTACLVRVPTHDEASIKRALDLGAAGIIVPQVNTAARAAQIVAWARYAPLGTRGVGIARACGYGMSFQDYVKGANDLTCVIVQAEHIRAVENIEEIVKIPGVDGVMLGPYDLSASLGLIGQIDHPQVVGAIDRVTEVCQKNNMKLGIFGVTVDAVRPYMERGYSLLVTSVDTIMIGQQAHAILKGMRQ